MPNLWYCNAWNKYQKSDLVQEYFNTQENHIVLSLWKNHQLYHCNKKQTVKFYHAVTKKKLLDSLVIPRQRGSLFGGFNEHVSGDEYNRVMELFNAEDNQVIRDWLLRIARAVELNRLSEEEGEMMRQSLPSQQQIRCCDDKRLL